MRVLAGTSGFAYKQWKGVFYPEDLPQAGMLGYYATQLPTVEINNTFYRMPRRELLQGWIAKVPEEFSFVLKASQRVTHRRDREKSLEALGYLMQATVEVAGRLGPMLFQFPPHARKDVERLREILAGLHDGRRAAFEFRHDSWFDDEVYGALRERGAALVCSDTEKTDEPPLVATGGYGYLRLRRPGYDDDALRSWAARVRAQPWEEAYVFFKHEDAGAGPRMARRFLELGGEDA